MFLDPQYWQQAVTFNRFIIYVPSRVVESFFCFFGRLRAFEILRLSAKHLLSLPSKALLRLIVEIGKSDSATLVHRQVFLGESYSET